MIISTWNVNGLRSRLDFVRHWLDARRPDIVCLQELKLTEEQFPYDELREAGYEASVHGQKAWNGVAVLTRGGAETVTAGLPGQEEMGARLITAKVDDLSVTSVYVPNGKKLEHADYPRKLDWLASLEAYLREHVAAEPNTIVGGDFNVCPAPIDSWNEEKFAGSIFHTDEERTAFAALLATGLEDVYRRLHPDDAMFSWWDYRMGAFHRGFGLRIDFLLATPAVRERVTHIEIDRDYRKKKDGLTASDHAPVSMTLDG